MPKRALVVIAQQGFQDHELAGTRDGLLSGGFSVDLCSKERGECTGKLGSVEQATVAMRSVDLSLYDRFAFIGGPGAAALTDDPDALALARAMAESGKVFGAICIAPTILAAAGVLQGKKATVWNTDGKQGNVLASHGAEFTNEDVTVDGRLVTANGPAAAELFGRTLAELT